MQTQRVTFLTSPEHKAALDAFASKRGESVGNVVREATAQYMAQVPNPDEAALALLASELGAAAPRIQASLDRTSARLAELHAEMDAFFHEKGFR